MSEIEKALKGETEEFRITNEERLQLIDVLSFFSLIIRDEKVQIHTELGPDSPVDSNKHFADFCEDMARRFANMPVHQEI